MIPALPVSWESADSGEPLEAGTLEIWRGPLSHSSGSGDDDLLTPEERACAACMLHPLRRAQFAAGHALLHRVRARHGMPLSASLSHSAQWILVAAVRSGPVGVDVETMRTDRSLDRLSERFFVPEEHHWLMQFPAVERGHLFYALWTAKEALFKALGMPVGAAHFAARRVFASESGPTLPQHVVIEGCRVGWFSAADGHMGAYAVPERVSRVRYLRSG